MAQITRVYIFVDGTTAYGSQVDAEVQRIVDAINNLDSGAASWTTIVTTGNITMSAGKTITMVSPDGTKTMNFGIDNNGNYGAM